VKRGLEYLARPRPEDQAEAVRLFRKALRLGPDRADAHTGLARVFLYLYTLGLDESPETLSSALSESRAAVELAPAALIVNPVDVDRTARAISDALDMPEAERQERARRLRRLARGRSPSRWLESQLRDLEKVRAG